jgi:hypothetical protein
MDTQRNNSGAFGRIFTLAFMNGSGFPIQKLPKFDLREILRLDLPRKICPGEDEWTDEAVLTRDMQRCEHASYSYSVSQSVSYLVSQTVGRLVSWLVG